MGGPRARGGAGDDPERRFFDKKVKSGEAFERAGDGRRWITALLNYDDKVDLLSVLNGEYGPKVLKAALSHALQEDRSPTGVTLAIRSSVIPLLKLLGSDQYTSAFLQQDLTSVVQVLFEMPGFVRTLKDQVSEEKLVGDVQLSPVVWFALCCAREFDNARKPDSECHKLAKLLIEKAPRQTKPLQTVLGLDRDEGDEQAGEAGQARVRKARATVMGVNDLQAMAGGRHDNDKEDYRSISIMPTIEELECTVQPYLPDYEATESGLLERQFRLLREDLVGPAREELQLLKKGTGNRRNVYENCYLSGVKSPGQGKPGEACVHVKVNLGANHRTYGMKKWTQRRDYWSQLGQGMLPRDALVCLCENDACRPKDGEKEEPKPKKKGSEAQGIRGRILFFASVTSREPEDLAGETDADFTPSVGLSVQGGEETVADALFHIGGEKTFTLIQITSSYFSYRPILNVLQRKTTVPLAREILDPRAEPETPAYVNGVALETIRSAFPTSLNPSQRAAMDKAFQQRLALLQGPPGTGKTFLASSICRIIYDKTKERLLIVAYTNHALDQLLEALLAMGINDMVRIGGRSKSTKLKPYFLRDLMDQQKQQNQTLQALRRRAAKLYSQREQAEAKVKELKWQVELGAFWESRGPKIDELLKFLWYDSKNKTRDRAIAEILDVATTDASGFNKVGKKGKSVSPYDHWNAWRSGKAKPGKKGNAGLPEDSPWRLEHEERKKIMEEWRYTMQQEAREDLATALVSLQCVKEDLDRLHKEPGVAVVRAARVVGCTTTGAAMHAELLSSVPFSVVMTEEAGELLEAHALTSLQAHTQHLIQIGDHKQLRPKIENYQLSVVSGNGYDLNRSLFERHVLNGAHHATLQEQHRMAPEISQVIMDMGVYPELKNHPATKDRDMPVGVDGRVVWIDHRVLETQAAQGTKWRQQFQNESKSNRHEAQMVAWIVRYLIQQGYKQSQITVLAPYLGQVVETQNEISGILKIKVDISEQDMKDLAVAAGGQDNIGLAATEDSPKQGENKDGKGKQDGGKTPQDSSPSKASSAPADDRVRVSTIDNYQGEENDVVINSWVRSNDECVIGFCKEPERLTVAVTRARCLLINIGNSHCLRNAKNKEGRAMWEKMMTNLEKRDLVVEGLPARCSMHGRGSLLVTPSDFQSFAPHGGCTFECGAKLPCGHLCPLKCHAFDRKHERVECKVKVMKYCDMGHPAMIMCSRKLLGCPVCSELKRLEKQRAEELARIEEEEADRKVKIAEEQAKAEQKMQDLQQKLAKEQADFQAEAVKERQRIEEEKLRHELDLMRESKDDELRKLVEEEELRAKQEMAKKEEDHKKRSAETHKKIAELKRTIAERQQKEEQEHELRKQRQLNRMNAVNRAKEEQRGHAKESALQSVEDARMALQMVEDLERRIDACGGEGSALPRCAREFLQAYESRRRLFTGIFDDEKIDERAVDRCLYRNIDIASSAASKPEAAPECIAGALAHVAKGKWTNALQALESRGEDEEEQGGIALDAKFLKAFCKLKLMYPSPSKEHLAFAQMVLSEAEAKPFSYSRPLASLLQALLRDVETSTKGPSNTAVLFYALSAAVQIDDSTCEPGILAFACQQVEELVRKHKPALTALRELAAEGDGAGKAPGSSSEGGVLGWIGNSLFGSGGSKAETQEEKWYREAGTSEALKELLDLTGMRGVKSKLFQLSAKIKLDKERKLDFKQQQFNMRFDGNPGTGKTTVARLYGKFLKEAGILQEDLFEETSGAKLVNGGTQELKKLLDEKLKDGGVLFIDEAYQLNPKTNPLGAQVLDYLLPEIENRRGKLVVVIAGYRKQMDELIEHNEGLPSRFPHHFEFEDYSDEELHTIFKGIAAKDAAGQFKVQDDKHARIAMRRLGQQRNTTGFGNARAVRNLWETAKEAQAQRILWLREQGYSPDKFQIQRDDLLGPRSISESSCDALAKLMKMRGLHDVKKQIGALLKLIQTNAELEEQEKKLRQVNLNRVLHGNPGTGKTTVAKLYGQILKSLGLLSKGDVVIRTPGDFIGSVLGESEKKTKALLESTKGSVLVIDEAYGLNPSKKGSSDPYREAVIDTIVAEVQGVPGDDRCVLLLGYKNEMEEMLRNANPGLKRRFNMSDSFFFADYSDDDLYFILTKKAEADELSLPDEAAMAAVKVLAAERMQPNFGNAGAVNNLLSRALQNMEKRLASKSAEERADAKLSPDDFLTDQMKQAMKVDVASLFDGIIGCQAVREQVQKFTDVIEFAKRQGKDPLEQLPMNFLFAGPPGTGKTTVARKMGTILHSLGLLATDNFVECSASDLVTGYANQAAKQTREKFREGLGGVLFVDEAYRLNPQNGGPFMKEALDEIVQLLTEDEFKNKMCVVFAGYEQDLQQMLKVNAGLKSRIPTTLNFPAFRTADALDLLKIQCRKEGLCMDELDDAYLFERLEHLVAAPQWSSGRDVDTLRKAIYQGVASAAAAIAKQAGPKRIAKNGAERKWKPTNSMAVTKEVFEAALATCLKSKEEMAPAGEDPVAEMMRRLREQPTAGPQTQDQQAPSIKIAEPTVQIEEVVEPEAVESQPAEVAVEEKKNFFEGIPVEFLEKVQDVLLAHGVDMDDMAQVASFDPETLKTGLMQVGVDVNIATTYLAMWKKAIDQVYEQMRKVQEEIEKKKRAQRPRWRCAACGRMGCPVAPYIEGYDSVDV